MREIEIHYPREMDYTSIDDLTDFLGALLEAGHTLDDAIEGMRNLHDGLFESI